MTGFLARRERFASVGSTNDVVRDWLAEGTPEVCLAVADEQTAGRGRDGRRWVAPRGAALLLSLGFRPDWLPPERVWRLAATAALAMADAAEEVAGLADGAVRLKWPNDLVIETAGEGARKLAGVLGETDGLGTDDPRVVVGHRHQRRLGRGRLPAGARRLDDVAARGGRRPAGRPRRPARGVPRRGSRRGSTRCVPAASTRRAGRAAS